MVKYDIKNTHYLPRIYDSEERRVRNLTRQVGEVEQEVTYLSQNVPILESGLIPARYLPSYVDDIIEGYYYNNAFYKDSAHTQLITGETGKIYVDLSTDLTYRWSGSAYVEVSKSIITGVKGDAESNYRVGNVNLTAANIGLGNVANLDQSKAIKGITRSGTTFTYTCLDGTTGTFTQQDNNTTYSAGTGLSLTNTTFALAESGATAGTYNNVTVDKYGRVTSGDNIDYLTSENYKSFTPSGTGWYRIGYTGRTSMFEIDIFCSYSYSLGHYKYFGSSYDNSKWRIVQLYGQYNASYIPKIRLVYNNNNNLVYIEVYYGYSSANRQIRYKFLFGTNIDTVTKIDDTPSDANESVIKEFTGSNTSNGHVVTDTDLENYVTTSALSGKKDVQTAVSDPSASGTSLTFIKTISQNTQGVITPTKATVSTMGASGSNAAAGLVPKPSTTAGTTKFLREDATWMVPTDTNTHRPIQVNGTQILGDNTTALNLKAGSNVSLSNSSGTVTIAATDTTYSSKEAASGGTAVSLVTTGEKYTWNNKSNLAIGTTATTAAAGNHDHDGRYRRIAAYTGISASSTSTKDLNDYTDAGAYRCTSTASQYVTHRPSTSKQIFVLYVEHTYNSSYIRQRYQVNNSKNVYERFASYDGDTSTWTFDSSWTLVQTDVSDMATKTWVTDQGYLTSYTDTKNTAGSTNTSSKIFLVGAKSQAANPQTYSHDTAFVDANGRLNSAAPASSANDTTVATTKWVKDQGYITSYVDTKNTAGSTDTDLVKLYLIGAKTQTTSAQTYSNDLYYIGNDNVFYGDKIEGTTIIYSPIVRATNLQACSTDMSTSSGVVQWSTGGQTLYIASGSGSLLCSKAWTVNSDIRKKNIISNIDIALNDIANAPLFNYKQKDVEDGDILVGTSAQYWQDVLPNAVKESSNGYLSLDYSGVALTSAITVAREVIKQDKKIKQLEEENKQFKEELQLLKSQINGILTTINKSTNNE